MKKQTADSSHLEKWGYKKVVNAISAQRFVGLLSNLM